MAHNPGEISADRITAAFNRASSAQQALQPQARHESQQVKQSAPNMAPRPTGPMREGPDRAAHMERRQMDANANRPANAQSQKPQQNDQALSKQFAEAARNHEKENAHTPGRQR